MKRRPLTTPAGGVSGRLLYWMIIFPVCRGRNQARDNVQSSHPAQTGHTPRVCCRAASPVLPAVPGCCRIRPPRLAYGAVFAGNSSKEKSLKLLGTSRSFRLCYLKIGNLLLNRLHRGDRSRKAHKWLYFPL